MKIQMIFLMLVSIVAFAELTADNTVKSDVITENNITNNLDQSDVVLSNNKDLRNSQKAIYETLPEKRSYWDTTLNKIKTEEKELIPDEMARMGVKK
ncbi:MAG: hypothetical protein KBF12_06865 [Sebaldella sp.]|nr:hypothetical protein [Sebaldella sp.]